MAPTGRMEPTALMGRMGHMGHMGHMGPTERMAPMGRTGHMAPMELTGPKGAGRRPCLPRRWDRRLRR